jgi:hypothetical protein
VVPISSQPQLTKVGRGVAIGGNSPASAGKGSGREGLASAHRVGLASCLRIGLASTLRVGLASARRDGLASKGRAGLQGSGREKKALGEDWPPSLVQTGF